MNKLPIDEYLKEAFKRNKSSQTHAEVHARATELIRRCWNEDVFIVFTDGLRTNIDQAVLYGKGRKSYVYNGKQYGNPNVKKVTNAAPGQSMHNYGLALDYVTCDGFGKNIDWVVGPRWKRAAAIAKELGFEWGGDWKSFYDAPHIEYNGGLTLAQIRAGKRPSFKKFTPIVLTSGVIASTKPIAPTPAPTPTPIPEPEKIIEEEKEVKLLNNTGRKEIRELLKKAREVGIIDASVHTDEAIAAYDDVQLLSYQAAVVNREFKLDIN